MVAAANGLLGADAGQHAVLVSLGARGAILVAGRRSTTIAAPTVKVVDTVGAGDTLNGALAAGLAEGRSIEGAARRAVVAASLAVTSAGAREGMPTTAQLEAALSGEPRSPRPEHLRDRSGSVGRSAGPPGRSRYDELTSIGTSVDGLAGFRLDPDRHRAGRRRHLQGAVVGDPPRGQPARTRLRWRSSVAR